MLQKLKAVDSGKDHIDEGDISMAPLRRTDRPSSAVGAVVSSIIEES